MKKRSENGEERDVGGRPTKWVPEINDKLDTYFSVEPFVEVKKSNIVVNRIPNPLPTLQKFAADIRVNLDTLYEWAKPENASKYPGFSETLERARLLQEHILNTNTLLGGYNPSHAKIVAYNYTKMREQMIGDKDNPLHIVNEVNDEQLTRFLKRHGKGKSE